MKLLLDEHLSPEIARQLRARGHDVIAVGERTDPRGRPDRAHFASLPDEQRAIVTRDLGDFRPLLAEALLEHVWLGVRAGALPTQRDGLGRLVAALDAPLAAHPEVDAAVSLGGEIRLQDPPGS